MLRIFLMLLVVVTSVQPYAKGENLQDVVRAKMKRWTVDGDAHRGLSGILAVRRFFQLRGLSTDISDLVINEFISSVEGSTAEDLNAAMRTRNLDTRYLQNVNPLEIFMKGQPFIARVRGNSTRAEYRHWVCVVICGSTAIVYDSEKPGCEVPLSYFLAEWDGTGIIETSERDGALSILTQAWMVILWILPFAAVVWLLRGSRGLSWLIYFGLSVLGLGLSSFAVTTGSANPLMATGVVVAPFENHEFATVSLQEMEQLYHSGSALMLDSRFVDDFRFGTIFDAVSTPFHLNTIGLRDALSDVEKDFTLCVFCQSDSCPYSHTLAKKLRSIGYKRILIAEEGVNEYEELQAQRISLP